MPRPAAGDPERPKLRELLPDEIWERFLMAVRGLNEAQQRIDDLTAQIEVLTAALREARGEAG
jgi:hypothetical protein